MRVVSARRTLGFWVLLAKGLLACILYASNNSLLFFWQLVCQSSRPHCKRIIGTTIGRTVGITIAGNEQITVERSLSTMVGGTPGTVELSLAA